MTEKLYISLYVIALLLLGFATMATGETYGEAINVVLPGWEIFVLMLVYLLTYVAAYQIYRVTYYRLPGIKQIPKMQMNQKKIHTFYFICLVVSMAGTVFFQVGRLGAQVTTRFSFLFSILKFSEFFPLYYVAARNKKAKLYWVNIAFFCVLRTAQGWMGWVLTVAVLELYFRIKDGGWIARIFYKCKSQLMAVAAILAGGVMYWLLIPLREAIRYGGKMEYYTITFWESMRRLVERLNNFPVYTSAWQNAETIAAFYHKQSILLAEFKSMFAPVVPSFLMPNKDIRVLGNLVQQAMWPTLENGTSTGFGFLMYWYTLLKCDFVDFMVCAITFIIGSIVTCAILKAFDNKDHDMRILWFIYLVSVAGGSSLSQLFGYGYLAALYLVVIMLLCGVIKYKV